MNIYVLLLITGIASFPAIMYLMILSSFLICCYLYNALIYMNSQLQVCISWVVRQILKKK